MHTVKPSVLKNMIKQLQPFVYPHTLEIPVWRSHTGRHIAPNEFTRNNDFCDMRLGDRWRAGYDDVRWFAATLTVPADMAGKKTYLQLDFGGEALVRIGGKIVGAVSSRDGAAWVKRDILLLDPLAVGETLDIELENSICCGGFCDAAMAGARDMELRMATACLRTADEPTEQYLFTVSTAFDALEHIADEVLRTRVYNAVDDSLHMLDFDFGADALRASVPAALEYLKNTLACIPHTPSDEVIMTGHSHLDVAWLWTVREIVRKTARTFSNNLALMERYPDFRFTQSQAVLYDFMKRYYPDIFARVKEKVRTGQWSIVGNAWVEADTNLASGESLVRQLLYGREFFLREFGVSSDIYWLPDCFGFTWALPQIIKRSGMQYFVTAKLHNNDTNPFPQSVFRWRAHSGDEILAYVQDVHYQGECGAGYVSACAKRNRQRAQTGVSMGMFGYGDGGGGCTYGMTETARALQSMPGLPAMRMDTPDAFFAKADEVRDELPVWDGELYYENHRGTYTSQGFVKKNNRRGEILFRNAELSGVFAAALAGLPFDRAKAEEGWRLLLINQFHDILPGTSIHEVYENTRREYGEMNAIGEGLLTDALTALGGQIRTETDAVAVFNLLPWEVGATVEDERGRFYTTVPPCGYRVCTAAERRPFAGSVTVTKNSLENAFLCVRLDENGLLTSIYDKTNARELLETPDGNLLTVFQDKPIHESAWNMELNYRKKYWELREAQSVAVVEDAGDLGAVCVTHRFRDSVIRQTLRLTADAVRLEIHNDIDWNETEKTLKAAFRLSIRSTRATYEIAHGAIERPTHSNTSYDRARFEDCAHKWADLSEGDYGISILNDCKYGYDIENNLMRITLLRSPNCPDPVADREHHSFVYAVYPHAGSWQQGGTVQEANRLNNPPLVLPLRKNTDGTLPASLSFLSVDRANIVLDACKPAQDGDGVILRFYEAEGKRGEVGVRLAVPAESVTACNLMEQDETAVPYTDGGFRFFCKPHELHTFRIRQK